MLEFQRILTSVADSIRTLNETEASLTLDEMGAIMEEAEKECMAIEEYINLYNNQDFTEPQLADEFVTGEASIFSNVEIEEILPYTFAYQDHIKKVAFQNCLSLHDSAFYNTKIIEGSFPECRYIGKQVFYEATSLTSINAAKCINIGSSAFYNCPNLSLVNFPACKEIGSTAFHNCDNIQEIILPECKVIGSYAFVNCSLISEVILPKCSSIGKGAFKNAQRLILPYMSVVFSVFQDNSIPYYSFSVAKTVHTQAFYNNSAIREIYLPNCTTIGGSAFSGCTSLQSISLPKCTTISRGAFYSCTSLQSMNLPKCTTIGSSAFQRCTSLQSIDLPKCTKISSSAFYSCWALSEIYLTNSSVCTLQNSSVFVSTPFTKYSSVFSGTPCIYVPSSLVASYQKATNWSRYSSYFVGI